MNPTLELIIEDEALARGKFPPCFGFRGSLERKYRSTLCLRNLAIPNQDTSTAEKGSSQLPRWQRLE